MFDLPSPCAVLPVAVNDVAVIEMVGGLSSSPTRLVVDVDYPGGLPPPPTRFVVDSGDVAVDYPGNYPPSR